MAYRDFILKHHPLPKIMINGKEVSLKKKEKTFRVGDRVVYFRRADGSYALRRTERAFPGTYAGVANTLHTEHRILLDNGRTVIRRTEHLFNEPRVEGACSTVQEGQFITNL